ncbi:MAG TPA: hypothetical protein VHB79_13280 [Polyangiaceae bacterium]|nr:hypothetical protein [Polyangiaceae bacterium]
MPARAEVPGAPAARGREFRVDFSARHLDVDADLGELSLSGDVEVTVGRYRLGGERVRLKRGPHGIGVEGGGDIAFCSCDRPPVTLGYRTVTIAPPSDVLIERAVLRVGGVPVFWLPWLWLRSPDRVGLIFPSVEWRGDDGLLLGSGIHVPFDSNQGRPAARALDISGFGYIEGGARVEARLLTPATTSLVRWDYRDGTALGIDAHGAGSGRAAAIWAYDADASLGARGRTALSSLEAAARRYDHARAGVASTGAGLFALGASVDATRGAWLSDPLDVGPFALAAIGGALGERTSYALDLAASSALRAGEGRHDNAETRGLERGSLESSVLWGPVLARVGAFEQGELLSEPHASASVLRVGAGAALSLPLAKRGDNFAHVIAPEALARFERGSWDGQLDNQLVATGGVSTAFGSVGRGAAARLQLAGGVAGRPESLEPLARATLASDARLIGLRVTGVGEPRTRAAETTARLRLGARGGTALTGYAEARTHRSPGTSPSYELNDVLPPFLDFGGYDREGLTTGGDLTLALAPSVVWLGAGADVDPVAGELLAVRSFARYRHSCGCVAVSGFAARREGRGGFDAGLSLDLMP